MPPRIGSDGYGSAHTTPAYCSTTRTWRHRLKPELIEHATRLLSQAPTRCINAEVLHDRIRRELAIDIPFDRFMETVRDRPDRFAVLSAPLAINEQRGWEGREQSVYAAALAAAGMPPTTITLVDQPADPTLVPAGTDATPGRVDLLADVHAGLADLLVAACDEPQLRDAVSGALAGLAAIEARLDHEERRSRTLHHNSSSSSAAMPKPAAPAADRMPAASSARIPERIAQPPGARTSWKPGSSG